MNHKLRMIRKLSAYVAQYKKDALLSPVCTIGCVILEILIPYLTASIIDDGIADGNMVHVAKIGLLMAVMALLAMFLGVRANQLSAKASTGFACNLREAMFTKVQSYSFLNIDKFSTAGLVTRLTTDVSNVQMAFQMLMMVCTRAPVTLIEQLFNLVVNIARKLVLK